ncbi:hypothetical protein IX324_000382 [Bacteroides pyogenes]|nr:hypothetical protein [Bacteroides pyogenes]
MRKGFERQETHPVRKRRNSKSREMAESMHRFVFQPKKVVIFACL